MSSFQDQLDRLHHSKILSNDFSITTILSYSIALLFLLHQILYHFDIASLSLQDVLWNTLVRLTPSQLVLDAQQRNELGTQAVWSQTHAAKSDSMRRALGLSGRTLMEQIPGAAGIARRFSMAKATATTNAPAGLGNWDNSCYQNSVLQGLTALTSLESFLNRWRSASVTDSTLAALRETTDKLRDPSNNGRHIWTPAKLKSMSSWQQQDAQEYFSKIMDELDKDISKAQRADSVKHGLEAAGQEKTGSPDDTALARNPLEGLLSQKVACTTCGFSEGLSMIPFNCLTVPLGPGHLYSLQECLDDYTKLEPITEVECAKCTLLKAQRDFHKMIGGSSDHTDTQPQAALRAEMTKRLEEVERALDEDDLSDETLKQKCQISKANRVASTKTRQALIARAPKSLIVHVNRSVFSELTGMQSKNYARVQYPAVLDLGPWILGSQTSNVSAAGLPREDLWKYIYRLKAIVTHYGRHENGHYIAYRQSPDDEKQWWRLSDEDVSASSTEDVLDQGGVFMLFYEQVADITEIRQPALEVEAHTQVESDDKMLIDSVDDTPPLHAEMAELPQTGEPVTIYEETAPSEASTTEDEFEQEAPKSIPIASTSPFMMRTANDDINNDHWSPGRFIAAT
ncbi:hypothetical protein AMS68_000034 [Peltaster fructicola]|uniref:ubiquitinyl hydrolase 1 n=1 Tax=Peltaster fructicola TaxID=286661 RepID=A0A6H0XIH3_9PEZI|nr:hypothetical protein AMS68_000034 [Peltaster fructicola]